VTEAEGRVTATEFGSDRRRSVVTVAAACLLAVVAGFACLYGLGANDVHEIDETWHTQVALDFLHHGRLWHPTHLGTPFYHKPCPPIWLMALSLGVLGPSSFAARLWAALFAIAAVLATFELGRRSSGVAVGFLSGFALATTYPFVFTHCGRTAELDSMMIFTFVLASVLLLRALETGRGWLWCAGVAAAASLVKNFAAAAPALVFALVLLTSRSAHRPRGRRLVLAMGLFAVVNLLWLLPMAVIHGEPFLNRFVGQQVLGRPTMQGAYSLAGVTVLYLRTIVVSFFPWGLLGLAGLLAEGRRAWTRRDAASLLVLTWVTVYLAVICLVLRRGFPWYPLPLMPFLAVAGGRLLVGSDDSPAWERWWRVVATAGVAAAAIVIQLDVPPFPFALWSIVQLQIEPSTLGRSLVLLSVGLAAALVAMGLRRWRRARGAGLKVAAPAVWAVLAGAAVLALAEALAAVHYDNAYLRTAEALRAARGEAEARLAISLRNRLPDLPARYYFGRMVGFSTVFFNQRPDAALALAKSAPAPAFAVLITGPGEARLEPGAAVLFRAVEPDPWGRPRVWVTVIETGRADPAAPPDPASGGVQ
jgi:4-amino-4-deoxy-L-arabinose transferase-like glycosyltransferase